MREPFRSLLDRSVSSRIWPRLSHYTESFCMAGQTACAEAAPPVPRPVSSAGPGRSVQWNPQLPSSPFSLSRSSVTGFHGPAEYAYSSGARFSGA